MGIEPEMSKSEEQMRKERQARQAAIKKRLETLPQDNPIVKAALDQKQEAKDRSKKSAKLEIVENLQWTAYNAYFDEGMSFTETVRSLGEALTELVKE